MDILCLLVVILCLIVVVLSLFVVFLSLFVVILFPFVVVSCLTVVVLYIFRCFVSLCGNVVSIRSRFMFHCGCFESLCDHFTFCCNKTHLQYLGVDPFGALSRLLYSSIEVNRQHVLWTSFLPGVSMPQPVIGLLHLQQVRQKALI